MNCIKNDKSNVSNEHQPEIYHEKQSRELCALHALNNLFQQAKTYTKKQLDEICMNLAPDTYVNPHRSILGLGNYDVNVIMAALQLMGYDTVWFDKRRNLSNLRIDAIFGFILNVPTDLKWGVLHVPLHRKHWITIRKISDGFYNLDSKLDSPDLIGNEQELIQYLKIQVQSKDKQLFLVVQQDNPKENIWSDSKTSTCDGNPPRKKQDVDPIQFKESGL